MDVISSEKDRSFDETDEMGSVVKNIYTSCDPENTDCVPVISLIEFIKPYLLEDLDALEDLKVALDPENKNVSVSSKKFYEVMSTWSKKVKNCSDDSEFNRSPSQLGIIDDKDLPYTQSTPRASFGEKLLKNKDLLNLSNVSIYSLSRFDTSSVDTDKLVLEETVKKLELQLSKVNSEVELIRLQLTSTEEQNELLQSDLVRVTRRLSAEQQVIEHLQKEKTCNEELREELNSFKKLVDDLKKKLSQSEKDSLQLHETVKKTEEEKELYEKKYEEFHQKYQVARKEIFDIKTELGIKEQEIATLQSANNDIKAKFAEREELCIHLKDENEILNHQKGTLEALKFSRAGTGDFPPAAQSFLNLGVSAANSGSEEELFMSFPRSVIAGEQGEQYESLKLEMYKADEHNSCYDQIIFEKDEKIFELEDEVTNLKNDIQALQEAKSKLEPEIENCKKTIKKLEEAQTELVNSNFVLTDNVECSNTKLFSVTDKLSEAEKNIKLLQDENNNKDEEIKLFKEHVCKNNEQILNDLDTHMKKNVELESCLLEDKLELTKLKGLSHAREKEVKDLTHKIGTQVLLMANVNRKLKDTESKLETVSKDLVQKSDLLQVKEAKIYELENNLKEITAENEAKLKEANDNIKEISEDLKATSVKVDEFSKEIEVKEVLLKEKEAQIIDMQDKVLQLTVDNKTKDLKYSELQVKLDNFAEQLAQKSVDLLEAIRCKETLQLLNKTNELKIKELEEKVNSLCHENIDISNTLKRSENELKQAEQKMLFTDNVEATMAQVQLHIDNRSAFVAELQQLNISLNTKICEVEEKLKNKISEVLALRQQLKKDVGIKNDLWKNLNTLKTQVDTLKHENEELIQKEQKLFNDNEYFNQEHNLLLNLYDNEVLKNGELNTLNSQLIEERDGLKDKFEKELNEKEELQQQFITQTKRFEEFEHNSEEQKLVNFELAEKVTSLETEGDKLRKKLQEYEKSFELLKASSVPSEVHKSLLETLDDKMKVNDGLISKIKELNEENTSLLSKYNEQININGQLTHKSVNYKEEYNMLSTKNSELADKVEQLDEEVNKLNREKDLVSDQLKESCGNHSDSCSVSSEPPKSKSFLKQQITIEKLKEKIDHLECQLTAEKSRRADMLKQKTELTEKVTESMNRIGILSSSNRNLNLKLSAKQTRIDNLTEDIKQMESLLESSDEHVQKLNADVKMNELYLQNIKIEASEKNELLQVLMSKVSDLEAKLQSNATELSARENKLQSLTLKLKETEEKYQRTYTSCVEKGHKIFALEEENKKMQEAVSKSDDLKKRELMDIEEKISSARRRLELTEFDLQLLKQNIEDSKKEHSLLTEAENKITRIVSDGRNELQRVTHVVFDEWKKHFDSEQVERLQNEINDLESSSVQTSPNFEDQIDLLNTQIGITSFLLECLVSTSTKMEALSVEQSEKTDSYTSESKRLHKFTLKAPTLTVISRPVSPDSPSLDVDVEGVGWLRNLCKGGDETQSFQQDVVRTEPKFQLSNLHLDDTLFNKLENLDVDDDSSCLKSSLTKSELEPYFTTLAVQLSVAGKDIKERLETQTQYYNTKQDRFAALMMDISSRLRDHICIGTDEPIMPVFVLLEELKMLVNELMHVTGQLGVLNFEQHMRKPWSLVINYVALLKQENEFLSNPRSESTPSPTSGLRGRMKKAIRDDEKVPKPSIGQRKAWGLRSPRMTLTVFMILVLFAGCVVMHWYCRANAANNQDCPLDSFVITSRVGPPPL